jgi:hypothetical protein
MLMIKKGNKPKHDVYFYAYIFVTISRGTPSDLSRNPRVPGTPVEKDWL